MGISTNLPKRNHRDEEYNHWGEKFNRQVQQKTRIHRIKNQWTWG